ncbi:hypothetical protein, partial [Nocardioides stalactiti]|uniref:hypothetical protein n=1 Tax=Nocardioides stalactiti TaxID=2755356 RepID=UPI0015FFE5A2
LAAVAGAFRPSRGAAGVILGVGVLLAAVPLGLGHVGKAHDTDALLDSLRPFSVEKVEAREAGLADALLVAGAYDGTSVPAEDLAALDAALDRFTALVALSRDAQPLLVDATEISASTTVGTSIGAGAALAAAGVLGLLTARRSAPRGTSAGQ